MFSKRERASDTSDASDAPENQTRSHRRLAAHFRRTLSNSKNPAAVVTLSTATTRVQIPSLFSSGLLPPRKPPQTARESSSRDLFARASRILGDRVSDEVPMMCERGCYVPHADRTAFPQKRHHTMFVVVSAGSRVLGLVEILVGHFSENYVSSWISRSPPSKNAPRLPRVCSSSSSTSIANLKCIKVEGILELRKMTTYRNVNGGFPLDPLNYSKL